MNNKQTKKGDILPDILHPCEECKRDFLGVKARRFCPDCIAAREREDRRKFYERKKLGLVNHAPIPRKTVLRVKNSKVTAFNFR